jgi:hypothetical protein
MKKLRKGGRKEELIDRKDALALLHSFCALQQKGQSLCVCVCVGSVVVSMPLADFSQELLQRFISEACLSSLLHCLKEKKATN